MALKATALKQTLKHKGFFNYADLYNFCYNYLKNEGYNIAEDEYTEKVSGFGKEIVIKWAAKKKVTDYYRNIITVKWHILGLNDAEVEIEGKKEKTNKGEVKIVFEAVLEKDWEDSWEKKPQWKFLRGVYDKYIVRTTNDEYEDRVRDDAADMIDQVKAFLNLEVKK